MRSEAHDRWRARILRWRIKYPDPRFKKGQYDSRKVRASPLRCVKCGGTKHVTRHHKGHEYLFACFMPEWYAERYIRFDRNDWVPLCSNTCHTRIHELYAPIVDEIKLYFFDCLKEYDLDDEGYPEFNWRVKPDRRVLESFRKRLIAKCDWWLSRKNKKVRRGKYKTYRGRP